MTVAIVPANYALLAEIEAWLDEEEARFQAAYDAWVKADHHGPKPPRGFRVNWDTIKSGFEEGLNPLDVLLLDGRAIGFLYGSLFVEIHPDHRRKRLGLLLADHMLRRAEAENFSVLNIQISPESAEPFWVGQGFIIEDDEIHFRNGLHAYRTIERVFSLGSGPRVPVTIEFYKEAAAYTNRPPFLILETEGERLADGVIQMPERVHGYNPLQRSNIDNHIRIVVDGVDLYFGRSQSGAEYGTSQDPNGNHFIDRILPGPLNA